MFPSIGFTRIAIFHGTGKVLSTDTMLFLCSVSPPSALQLGGYSPSTLLSAPKHTPLTLELSASGQLLRLQKNPGESVEHLVLKALLWALLLPTHPSATCELDLGLRYRPDVIALDEATGAPCWWGECGSVKGSKLSELSSAFPLTRFSVAKWGRSDLRGYANQLRAEIKLPRQRAAPFEVVSFPADSIERFVAADGQLSVSFEDLQVVPLVEVVET